MKKHVRHKVWAGVRGCVPLFMAWLMAFAIVVPAHAGRSCEAANPPKLQSVERGLTLAERTYKALQASGAKVVVLARPGQAGPEQIRSALFAPGVCLPAA